MKKTLFLVGVFVVSSAMTMGGVIASQSSGGQTEKAKEGSQKTAKKSHSMTGCLEKGSDENTFRLTNIEGTGPKTAELHADAKLKLSGHVGHQVAITGTEIDPKTMKKESTGAAGAATAPASKGAAGEHHMRVESMKHIAGKCS
jgi:hypothetical protein